MRSIWKLAGLMLLLVTAGCGTTRSVLVEESAGGDALARIAGSTVEPGDLLEIDLVDGTRLQGTLEQVGVELSGCETSAGPAIRRSHSLASFCPCATPRSDLVASWAGPRGFRSMPISCSRWA